MPYPQASPLDPLIRQEACPLMLYWILTCRMLLQGILRILSPLPRHQIHHPLSVFPVQHN
jgi:hypothetical protein